MVRTIIPGTARWRIAATVVALGVCFGATRHARAGEPDVAGTVEELKALLERYDRAGGGDTIPVEQAWEIRARLLAGMGDEGAAGEEKVVFVDREGKASTK
jgi:hypothetical protein